MFFRMLSGGGKLVSAILTARHYPSAATNAVCTIAAAATGYRHVLHKIMWSYSAAPTDGRITVTDNAVLIFDKDITVAGPGGFSFSPRPMSTETAMVVTLYSGAGSVVGKLDIEYSTESSSN